MRKLFISTLLLMSIISCSSSITRSERKVINQPGDYMRVLTIADHNDSIFLRQPCKPFTIKDIQSDEYATLARRMSETMTSPDQDGVGIAGPQVGLHRRIIAVMRLDKEGEPVEVYANPRIIMMNGEMKPGPEGCLSVPDCRGDVLRYRDITITYLNPVSLSDTTERIEGYTSIIFQHEIDHLDGILYIDKLLQ